MDIWEVSRGARNSVTDVAGRRKRIRLSWLRGFPTGEFRDVRLQPPQRQIPPCESRRQADDALLWYRHARICCVRRCERGGLRSTGDRIVVCSRGHVPTDWYLWLAR